MAKPSKKPSGDESALPPIPFEKALAGLEEIVGKMESGELPLDAMLEKYEEGARLVAICKRRLEEAELRISRLEESAAGEMNLTPFEPGAEGSESET